MPCNKIIIFAIVNHDYKRQMQSYLPWYLSNYTAHDSGYGSGIRKSQLYNARGKKLAEIPMSSKLPSTAISFSSIDHSSSSASLNKDTSDVGKGRIQLSTSTSPNKKAPSKQLPPTPVISNSDLNPNAQSSQQDSSQQRPLKVPDNIPEPHIVTPHTPVKSPPSFFQRLFQRQ